MNEAVAIAEPTRKAKKTLVEVNPQLHTAMKSQAALRGKSMKDYTDEVLRRGMGLDGTVHPELFERSAS